METMNNTDSANFNKDVIENNLPAFVDFYADWCGPCRTISPIIKELSEKYNDKMKFFKLDVDKSPDIATKFGVSGIPTLFIFKSGEVLTRMVGASNKQSYENEIIKAIS
tara:strand:+ start:30 stop:356 length:327 start_codon:yes stop_codon:yes gene_type:complete